MTKFAYSGYFRRKVTFQPCYEELFVGSNNLDNGSTNTSITSFLGPTANPIRVLLVGVEQSNVYSV